MNRPSRYSNSPKRYPTSRKSSSETNQLKHIPKEARIEIWERFSCCWRITTSDWSDNFNWRCCRTCLSMSCVATDSGKAFIYQQKDMFNTLDYCELVFNKVYVDLSRFHLNWCSGCFLECQCRYLDLHRESQNQLIDKAKVCFALHSHRFPLVCHRVSVNVQSLNERESVYADMVHFITEVHNNLTLTSFVWLHRSRIIKQEWFIFFISNSIS